LKTLTKPMRHTLNGPTMGTRWSALFYAPEDFDVEGLGRELADAVETVDMQMSTWKPQSDLMRVNAAPIDDWIDVPEELFEVLATGLDIGRKSNGAFDIGMGDVVTAWGFGPKPADTEAIGDALRTARLPAHDLLELDHTRRKVRKLGPITLDLSGIAKGYGVDCMMAVLEERGIGNALLSLDGELRACGARPDNLAWTVAVERPDYETREPLSVLELNDSAVATSGDYRHWVEAGGKRLSHTMNPAKGGPLFDAAASVTVVAPTCIEADAWATALMVSGLRDGAALADQNGLAAVFIHRDGEDLHQTQVGMGL